MKALCNVINFLLHQIVGIFTPFEKGSRQAKLDGGILRKTAVLIALFIPAFFISAGYAAASAAADTAKTPVITGLNETADASSSADKIKADSIFSHEGFSINEYQDSVLGFVGEAKVSSYVLDNEHAAALELNGGPRIFRLNATYGVNLTNNQRIKVTGERLDEKLDFDFTTDTVSHWVGQNALGADYAYMLDNKVLQSLGFGGYYTHSPSKDISNETVHDSVNDLDYLAQQRIAGANSGNAHLNMATHLWPYSRLSGGVDYDTVRFDTQYTDQDVQGFGGHAAVEQRLFPTVKLTLSSDLRQTEHGYSAGLSWLTPSLKGMQTELEAITDFTKDLTSAQRYYTTGLRFNMALDDNLGGAHQAIYADLNESGSQQSLIDWTRTPSVRMANVLAVADGSTIPMFLACPDPDTLTKTGNTYSSGGWSGTSAFSGTVEFQQAQYASIGGSECDYLINGIHPLSLENTNGGVNTGRFWAGSAPAICNATTQGVSTALAGQCHFVDNNVHA
ncbi:MAG: hypothetical protein K0R12_1399 [Gammaproteobacteria bacterium]|nr:hypothetical protein [Gammaproteobacteria bacterium]